MAQHYSYPATTAELRQKGSREQGAGSRSGTFACDRTPLLPAPGSLLPLVGTLAHRRAYDEVHRRWFMEARITAQSQSFKLRERLQEAKVSHGQEVRADLPNVRVAVLAATGEAQLMFCNMGSIRVRELVQPGDQGPLASEVTLQGLAVPFPGTYDLVNARISVNGSIHVAVDLATEVVPNGRRSEERRVGKECRTW